MSNSRRALPSYSIGAPSAQASQPNRRASSSDNEPPTSGLARARFGPVVAALAFMVLAVVGRTETQLRVNVWLTTHLQLAVFQRVLGPLSEVVVLGAPVVGTAIIAVYAIVLWRRGAGTLALLPAVLFGVGLLLEVVMKLGLGHPAVWRSLYHPAVWYPFPGFGGSLPFTSPFPSGHALRATYLALVGAELVIQSLPRRAWPVFIGALELGAWLLALASGLSVVYLGWHWPADAVGGITLGYILAWVTSLALARRRAPRSTFGERLVTSP